MGLNYLFFDVPHAASLLFVFVSSGSSELQLCFFLSSSFSGLHPLIPDRHTHTQSAFCGDFHACGGHNFNIKPIKNINID